MPTPTQRKMIKEARKNVDLHREHLTYWEGVLAALEGKPSAPGQKNQVSDPGVNASERIRQVYRDIEGEFDKNFVIKQLKDRWPNEDFDPKFVSTALGKDAKRSMLVVVKGRVANQPAVYRTVDKDLL